MGSRSGQSYSQDLRDRVLGAVDSGMAVRQAATTFQVSIAYIYKVLIRRRLTGNAGISPRRGHPPRKLSPEQDLALAAHIRSRPGITLAQAQVWLQTEHGIELSTGAMWNAAKRLGLSYKKKPCAPRSRTGPTSPHAANCGGRLSRTLTLKAWSSSMRPALTPRWRGSTAGRRSASAAATVHPLGTGRR